MLLNELLSECENELLKNMISDFKRDLQGVKQDFVWIHFRDEYDELEHVLPNWLLKLVKMFIERSLAFLLVTDDTLSPNFQLLDKRLELWSRKKRHAIDEKHGPMRRVV